MIVGEVSLPVRPATAGFAAELTAATDAAAEKAGLSAGRVFSRSFAASMREGTSVSAAAFGGGDVKARTAGVKAGEVYARGFTEAVRVNGQGAATLNAAGATAKAREQGLLTGQAFSGGVASGLTQADLAARKMAASVQAAAQTATVAARRAADAAAALAKAQSDAVVAAERLAKGEIAQEEATAAAEKVTRAQTVALEAEARAALTAERASIVAADAQVAASARAAAAMETQAVTAATVVPAALTRGARTAATIAEAEGGRAGRLFGSAFGGAAAPLAAVVIGAASVKLAGNFEQQTNVLVTAAGENVNNLKSVRKGILDIAVGTGTAWKDVTAATYDAEKAGYRGSKALDIVKASAQGAREENAQLATVTAGVTTTMANFGKAAGTPVKVVNQLKTASGEAKTTFEEFTAGLGNFESRAAAAHISLSDVLGVYASTTQTGITAQRASQNIGSTIQNLTKPLGPALNLMGQFGIDSVDLVTKLGDGPGGRGLAGTLNYLSETVLKRLGPSGTVLLNTFNQSRIAANAANTEFQALPPEAQKLAQGFQDGTETLASFRKGARALPGELGTLATQWQATYSQAHGFQDVIKQGGPATQTYLAALRTLTGGQQGLTVALAATGGQYDATVERSKRVADAARGAGKDVSGWASTQKLFNVQWDSFKQSIQRTAIELGTELLPPLEKTFHFISEHPKILEAAAYAVLGLGAAWTAVKIGNIVSDLGRLIARIRGVGAASTVAAEETRAANLAGAASGATGAAGAATGTGAAGAAGTAGIAARLAGSSLVRAAIPIALVIAGIDAAKSLPKIRDDLEKTHFADAVGKVFTTKVGNALTFGLGKSIGDLAHGHFLDAFQHVPGVSIVDKLFGGGDLKLSGKIVLKPDAFNDAKAKLTGQLGDLNQQILTEYQKNGNSDLEKQLEVKALAIRSQLADLSKKTSDDAVQAYLTALSKSVQLSLASLSKSKTLLDSVFHPKALTKDQQAQQVGDYLKSLAASKKLFDVAFPTAGSKAIDTFHSQLAGLGSQLTSTSRDLIGNSDVAMGNRLAITGLADTARNAATAYAQQTGKTSDYSAALSVAIPQIESAASALGFNKQQVDFLIASLGLLPPEKATKVDTDTFAAQMAISNYLTALNAIPQNVITTVTAIYGSVDPLSANDPRVTGHKAAGGLIRGPGSGTSDTAGLFALSDHEYVMPAHVVKQMGVGFFDALRSGSGTPGGADGRHYATGGLVSTDQKNVADYLKALAKQAQSQVATYLKSLAQIAKIGVTGALKTTTGDVKAGQAAIAAAVKEGNGPLQRALAGRLTTAERGLYGTSLAAVRDNAVSPAEALAITRQAKIVTDLTAQLTKLNTVNQGLIDRLKSYVSAEQDFRNSLKDSISQGAGFSDLLALSGSPTDLRGVIGDKLATVKAFASKMVQLKTRGFSNAIIRDVSNDGIDKGSLYADVLLTATKADVSAINGGFGALTATELSTANQITKATEGTIPGLSKAGTVQYIQTAIFASGANVDKLIGQAETRQRTYDSGGYLYPGRTVANNASGARELILDPQQTLAYERSGRRAPAQVTQTNHFHGADLGTAQAQAARDLSLALAGARVDG